MFPAEFVDRFGIPVVKSYTVSGSWVMIADRNPDRYFLGIVGPTGTTSIMYESNDPSQFASISIGSGGFLFLPHALYGSLVNGRWFAFNAFFSRITVIEGFMPRVRN